MILINLRCSGLGLREIKQIHFGNTLLLFCIEALILLVIHGGFGLIEHPAMPEEPGRASIWKLPLITFLRSFPAVQMVDLDQGYFGARSRKATTFLAVRLPELVQNLERSKIRSSLPHHSSIGIGVDGNFLTAGLKEYPPALCHALGVSFAAAAANAPPCAKSDDPLYDDFTMTCRKLESRDFGVYMGKDFAG